MTDHSAHKFGPDDFPSTVQIGDHEFDHTDLLLIAMLRDGVVCPEFCWRDPNNTEHHGCYRVRDYQVKFNRVDDQYAGFACARSVGKTERQNIQGFLHYFRRVGQSMMITAPELLHLLPLTDAIERRIESCRLLRECLRKDKAGKTGFSHNPFGVDYWDGTRIVGRIPNKDGRGVKGQHQPVLMIEEAQDYPDAGWIEVDATVMREKNDFNFHFYGVYRGMRGGGFSRRTQGGMFNIYSLTAIQRPGWGKDEKQAAIETYGGTSSPDYRRNILGEPGAASSPIFVTARLMSVIDLDRESRYNTHEYVHQHLRWEDYKNMGVDLSHLIDLPGKKYDKCVVGIDIGLTNSPTVCSIFGEIKLKGQKRLALVRRITLERFTSPQIRMLVKLICAWNPDITGIGMDITGLGFPIFQEMLEDEERPPEDVLAKVKGWKFNEKIPTYGNAKNPDGTLEPTMMSVVEATTRYLREWVDTGYLLLPFDTEITADLLAENIQRVESLSRLTGSKKPNAFHILDSFRMAALVEKVSTESEYGYERQPVFDIALGDLF